MNIKAEVKVPTIAPPPAPNASTKTPREQFRTILKVETIKMSELKKGDKFLVLEDGAFLFEGRLCYAEEDGSTNDKGIGEVEAHVI